MSDQATPDPVDRPVLRVISGDATPEEIATIVAVLTATSAGGEAPAPTRQTLWSDSTKAPGHRITPGPGAWRASGLPR